MRLSGPYQTIQLTLVRCRLAFCHSLRHDLQSKMSALQVWASRVRFNLTLIPERFSPQKLTQVEQLSLWPPSSKQTTRPPVQFALLPGPPAPHGASCDETMLLCRAGGCGMTNLNRRTHNPPLRCHAGVYDSTVRRYGNLGTPLARTSDLLFPVVRLRESKCAVLLSQQLSLRLDASIRG